MDAFNAESSTADLRSEEETKHFLQLLKTSAAHMAEHSTQTSSQESSSSTVKFLIMKYKCVMIFALALLVLMQLLYIAISAAVDGGSVSITLQQILSLLTNVTEVASELQQIH
jgi:hypothetical protein